ncbi:MAG: YggT family protein [Clostridia bacterium]|nr:YggT family protein [Clostridia bacterium]
MITNLIVALLDVYKLLLIVYVVLSWMKVSANKWTELLRSVIEPVLNPIRKFMAQKLPTDWQKIDWSPVVLWVLISIVQWLL